MEDFYYTLLKDRESTKRVKKFIQKERAWQHADNENNAGCIIIDGSREDARYLVAKLSERSKKIIVIAEKFEDIKDFSILGATRCISRRTRPGLLLAIMNEIINNEDIVSMDLISTCCCFLEQLNRRDLLKVSAECENVSISLREKGHFEASILAKNLGGLSIVAGADIVTSGTARKLMPLIAEALYIAERDFQGEGAGIAANMIGSWLDKEIPV